MDSIVDFPTSVLASLAFVQRVHACGAFNFFPFRLYSVFIENIYGI